MNDWKTKIFGDTTFNFYGVILLGLVVFGWSFFEIVSAIRSISGQAITHHLLLAIWILLMGQFAVTMQNYCSRVAKALDEKDNKK